MKMKENELIARSQGGDHRAFEVLVKKYQRKVFGIAYGIVRNPEDALDISQEAFYRAYRNLVDFKGQSRFYTWIYRITVNLALDFIQKQSKAMTTDFDDGLLAEDSPVEWNLVQHNHGNPIKELETKELAELVSKCMDRLSENHRAVIVLREFDGLSYEEISDVLGCSLGTVMSRLFHARNKMKRMLHGYLSGED